MDKSKGPGLRDGVVKPRDDHEVEHYIQLRAPTCMRLRSVVSILPPAAILTDPQGFLGWAQEALLLSGKDLGKKSAKENGKDS